MAGAKSIGAVEKPQSVTRGGWQVWEEKWQVWSLRGWNAIPRQEMEMGGAQAASSLL